MDFQRNIVEISRTAIKYAVRDIAAEILRPALSAQLRTGEFWAVDDVSLTLGQGEAICVAGHNGAGKSTLLKLLYGLLKPDRGEIRIRGRTAALIELGSGLNSNLTGRENVELAGAIANLDTAQTRTMFEHVVQFAELDAVLDSPVASYSSGMRARLAFATAIALRPDLLLVDEVLAVGDVAFQRKCLSFMRSYLDEGGALLFISHNVHQIQSICGRGLLLDRGRVTFCGSAVETVSRMLHTEGGDEIATDDREKPTGPVIIQRMSITPVDTIEIMTGRAVRLDLDYSATDDIDIVWGFTIVTRDHCVVVTGGSHMSSVRLHRGEGRLSCVVRKLPVLPGVYVVRSAINEASSHAVLAACGWQGAGLGLKVQASPDLLTNAQVHLGQLVHLDVEWAV